MKEILQKALKLYGLTIVAGFMCVMLVITFNFIGTAFFTEKVGYVAYGALEGEEGEELYTHYYADGEDEKLKTYEDKGYVINKLTIRDYTSENKVVAWDIITEIFLLIMMTVFVYNNLWNLGDKDKGAVIYRRKKEDKLKGLKIGLIASIPSFIITTVIFVGRTTFAKEVSVALYAFLNAHWYKLIILISGGGYFHELKIWEVVVFYALLFFVPLVAHIAYTLGYKSFMLSEKLIYKKK